MRTSASKSMGAPPSAAAMLSIAGRISDTHGTDWEAPSVLSLPPGDSPDLPVSP